MIISLANTGRRFEAGADQLLLDAAQHAALNLPHSCRSGNCGACKARLLRGEIHYPGGRPLGLSDAEMAEGMILLCKAQARTDLQVEIFELHSAGAVIRKRLPCRIERAIALSHDVMGLYLRLPLAEEFVFQAGQYIDILLPGGRRRSFSIASPPHDARPLELHVRHVPGGEFTGKLFHDARLRDDMHSAVLDIEGPLGTFNYRPHAGESPPMLLIGGGTGIAPLLSIVRHVIENRIPRNMRLFWGVRSEQDLYANERLQALVRAAGSAAGSASGSLSYVPVLSEAAPAWRGLTGWVHEAAFDGVVDLGALEVYAAGPPGMIAAIQQEYAARGCSMQRLYVDSFDYAPDTLERQRISAATKS
jgi:CDP-4-dehydro-6-deoxyglucose reductase